MKGWQYFILAAAIALGMAARTIGQQAFTPHIGYVFPAGGRQGTSLLVKVGGQYLNNVTNACISGQGVKAEVVEYTRPLTPQQANDLRKQLQELQDKRAALRSATNQTTWTAQDTKMAAEIRAKLAQFQKRTTSPALAETVTLRLTISSNAEPNERELRLGTPSALSEPLIFCIGRLAEFYKPVVAEQQGASPLRRKNDNSPRAVDPVESRVTLPCVANGQVMPGGVDRYRFYAHAGQHLVISVKARDLMPYLADAVPGWFQAALSLYDPRGHEVAFADHFRFHPDPIICCEAPADGEYVMQIRDSIYRGREDFVYRITAGELPCVTDVFPLGGRAGTETTVDLAGWNLPVKSTAINPGDLSSGIHELPVELSESVSVHLPFAIDALPECVSLGGNHSQATAQSVALPIIVNGRVEEAGAWNAYRFEGQAGEVVVAEVIARRLNSPLDSVLKLTDDTGRQIAFNDDFEDKGAGLQTHYADSYLRVTLPQTGTYFLYLGDAQQQAGPAYAYRLRISPPRPDFDLRVTPSSVTVRGGLATPLTVYAVRRDGYSNEIALSLKNAPPGFVLSGGEVPANENQVRLTLAAPPASNCQVYELALEGRARIQGQDITRPVTPADNMMQAFAYWHLVPSQDLEVSVLNRPPIKIGVKILDLTPIKIPLGGNAEVRVRTPGRASDDNLEFDLSEPPDGISLARFERADGETKLVLLSAASKTKAGLKGNLIVNIVTRRPKAKPNGNKAAGGQPRMAIGALPAIPFEIVPRDLLAGRVHAP